AMSLMMLMGRGTTFTSIRWALFTGLMISGYQVIDAMGTREASSGVAYGYAVAVAVSVTVNVAGLARGKGPAVVREIRRYPGRLVVAGILMPTAYTMVLVAFRDAPIGYVSVLRESSVLLGALLGWLFLREGLGRYRVTSAGVMILGMSLLITGG
ncbi:MAG TPA: EamA family transporter, partial [Acidimicrobiales bacterium]|nr:EamA family transporter [Acidimicrobiales bacterium]